MCREKWHFTEEELHEEYSLWQAYCAENIPPLFPGVEELIRRQKAEGGLICVVSLSSHANITRDYQAHFGFQPDAVYACELPREVRKPNPWPLQDIMERFGLKPEDLLVVDDMKLGWTTARAAGSPVAHASWSKPDFPELMKEMREICEYSFETVGEFEQFLFE